VEILTGQAAVSQAHKNPKNTFLDVRKLLENADLKTVNVPALDKDITVTELASHFFRNIHNQIKMQVGKAVRDVVVSVPASLGADGPLRARLVEAAQIGGCRIKSTIDNIGAVLNAHGYDNAKNNPQTVAVVDLGFSHTEVHIYTTSGGLYFLKSQGVTNKMCGNVLVNALLEFCAKDFMRKAKFPIDDNIKSMTRLRNECEVAMKALSTGAEAMIDLDSLCEGVDYSAKISRARFEDLGGIAFMQLKNVVNEAVSGANLTSAADITRVVLAGGLSGMPKCSSVITSIFPAAELQRTRGLDFSEAAAVGAALQGRNLLQLSLLEKPPANNVTVNAPCMNSAMYIKSGSAGDAILALPAGSVLPAHYELSGACPAAGGCVQVLVERTQIGELVFVPDTQAETEEIVIVVDVDISGSVTMEARQTSSSLVLASVTVCTLVREGSIGTERTEGGG